MKKHLLTTLSLLTLLVTNAQVYFMEDFSSGTLGQFTAIDADGDTATWDAFDYVTGNGEGFVAFSASFDNSTGALTPDNWLISDSIDLSTASGTIDLKWKVIAQDQMWASENYSVYVSTMNDTASFLSSSTSFTEVLTTSTGYMDRVIDVSSYAGSTIFVAFRHHDCTDQYRMNLDDITVKQLPSEDISAVSIDGPSSSCAMSGQEVISATVENLGGNDVYAFNLSYSVNGGAAVTETIADTLLVGGTLSHDFTTTVDMSTPGLYEIVVFTTMAGDADSTNDTVSTYVLNTAPYDLSTDSFHCGFEPSDSFLLATFTVEDANMDGSSWGIYTDSTGATPTSGIGMAGYSWNSANAANDWLITSCFDLVANQEYWFSIHAASRSSSFPENVEAYYGTANNSAGLTNMLVGYNSLPDSMIQLDTVFTVATSGLYYFGIKATSPADMYNLYVDDLIIKEYVEPVDTSSNVLDLVNAAIEIYPNPAKNNVNITLGNVKVNALSVLSVTGQRLMTLDNLTQSVNISIDHLVPGFYMIQINTEAGVIERKLIIE